MSRKEELRKFFDFDKNVGVDFGDIPTKDFREYWWKCAINDCSFKAPFYSKYTHQRIGYPIHCSECHNVEYSKSLKANVSEELLNKYYDLKKNDLKPNQLYFKSGKKVYVKCDTHLWYGQKRFVSDFADHVPCPSCNGKGSTQENNLKVLFPELSARIHSDYDPEKLLPYSNKLVKVKCENCTEYLEGKVATFTTGSVGCPYCGSNKKISATQSIIYYFLNSILVEEILINVTPKKIQETFRGVKAEFDLVIEEAGLLIEYDSYWFHKKERTIERDLHKNKLAKESGYNLVRLREKGLPVLSEETGYYHQIEFQKYNLNKDYLVRDLNKLYAYLLEVGFCKPLSNDEILDAIKLAKYNGIWKANLNQHFETFNDKYQGLWKLVVPPYKNRKYALNSHKKVKCKCQNPKCKEGFWRAVRNLKTTMGRCPECSFIIPDPNSLDSTPIRKLPKVKEYKRTLEFKHPKIAKTFSSRNFVKADQVFAGSTSFNFWFDCLCCNESYVDTVYNQVNTNGKCKNCGRRVV
ncbi:zinc-ribbon domain-containing protein [Alkalibacillus haloalkaliphilus]|uniref:zinc-ribbon domain-containing protein n=1 Tax=Alkalibacillus haloalkaliphilus TaxID=94136 RepID=UPI002936951C|nr:zinc-ribbon domain-containing protein [Alkalibacillus haloalkaliphilus]MDV2581678.1 zinc-ribbon domain-containing protein [Alkalibacillus haloalkaliphilus]